MRGEILPAPELCRQTQAGGLRSPDARFTNVSAGYDNLLLKPLLGASGRDPGVGRGLGVTRGLEVGLGRAVAVGVAVTVGLEVGK